MSSGEKVAYIIDVVPLYEYQCKKCKHRFEKIHQSYAEPRVKKCPECGGPVEELLSAPAAHFKGTGWYATDYAKKSEGGGKSGSDGAGATESVADDSSASKAKEKTETKSAEKGPSKESSKESKPKAESKKRK